MIGNIETTFLIVLFALNGVFPPGEKEPYSFFVAGHTYGYPDTNFSNLGIHPPFKAYFPKIKKDPAIKFGVLTGDIVIEATEGKWDAVEEDLSQLDMPVYFAPGNHDIYKRELYIDRFGDPYFSLVYNGDLFIILDPNLDRWSISGDQLKFLKKTIRKNKRKVKNIFVFMHQLLWWKEKNIFRNIHLNYPPYTPETLNFWSKVEPLFHRISNDVYLFAGDLGAHKNATHYMYYHYDNITFVASGMGSMTDDNFIIVDVDKEGGVSFRLIALQGEEKRLGKLEDYTLP